MKKWLGTMRANGILVWAMLSKCIWKKCTNNLHDRMSTITSKNIWVFFFFSWYLILISLEPIFRSTSLKYKINKSVVIEMDGAQS